MHFFHTDYYLFSWYGRNILRKYFNYTKYMSYFWVDKGAHWICMGDKVENGVTKKLPQIPQKCYDPDVTMTPLDSLKWSLGLKADWIGICYIFITFDLNYNNNFCSQLSDFQHFSGNSVAKSFTGLVYLSLALFHCIATRSAAYTL